MTESFHDKHYPGETDDYRRARDELLEAELELRDRIEEVAAMRRALPPGAPVKEDYVFEEGAPDFRDTRTVTQVKLSELFSPDKSTLILINTMFAPEDELPCPMCNMWADGYNAIAPHIAQRVNFALVTKADISRLRAWAAAREWRHIRLLSSHSNSFNRDYLVEIGDAQMPSVTVFTRAEDGKIHHFYSVEGHFARTPGDPRHIDLCSPLWNLLDLTPEGRGSDWYPGYSYD
ncbi:MAG: DUF899 family protein [Gammaproteobacteria bacterium]